MTDAALVRVVVTREAAHEAASEAYRAAREIVERVRAGGEVRRARILVEEYEEDRSLRQNKFYWAVLRDIAEQARLEGQHYTADAWHELGKRQFLGYEIKRVKVAGRKHPVTIRRLRSTRKLPVSRFAKYLEELMAFAVTDLGVTFRELRWEDYRE